VPVFEGPVQALIDELGRLPGIGPKSAQRIAFYLLKVDPQDAKRLAAAILDAKERVSWCRRCYNFAEGEYCTFCRDERRDSHVVCVVEEPRDIAAIERTNEFRGRYHVLQGAISPIEGIGPEQLRVKELLARVPAEEITEVILATNPNIEGEATPRCTSPAC
jgi:recombination protein RecR